MNTMKKIWIPAALSLGIVGGACTPNVGTIDRIQPNALPKSQFEGLWYYRTALVDSDPETGIPEGLTSRMDKIRWEITEDQLIAYRSYEFIPYAEGLTDEGRDFFGSPVAAFKILSHFNIQREYSEVTGVENNVLVENNTDAPWNERAYMRIDWSQNMVGGETKFWTGWESFDGQIAGRAESSYYVQGHEETNPDRPFITADYMDFTNVYHVNPSPSYCYFMLLYNSVPRCGAGNARVRLAFRKVDPSDDYEPLFYPDRLELKDDQGNAIVLDGNGRSCENLDPARCQVRTVPYDAQYGNFRIQRPAFDQERPFSRSGRLYLAGRFNLWEDSYRDIDGSRIPYAEREPVPVVYYGSPTFPPDLYEAAQLMADGWNEPFSQTVAYLKEMCVDQAGVPTTCTLPSGKPDLNVRPDLETLRAEMAAKGKGEMFQFRPNDCNAQNIIDYATKNGLQSVVSRVAGAFDASQIGLGNVEQVCAAMQFAELEAGATLDPKVAQAEGRKLAFTWQREGDLRYNFQNYVHQYQPTGPWGVAQFGQDPETGQFVANVANYFGAAGDRISQNEVDLIQWLNGDLDEEELFRGDFARDTVVSRRQARNTSIRSLVKQNMMAREGEMIEAMGESMFPEAVPGAEKERMKALFAGTDVEAQYLVNDEMLRGLAGPELYQPTTSIGHGGLPVPAGENVAEQLSPGDVSAEALAAASPVNLSLDPQNNPYMKFVESYGRAAFELADFFSFDSSGLAWYFKGKSREEIYTDIRAKMYTAVQGHEVGHTLGLRHNFEASMDPLNYHPDFWCKEVRDGECIGYYNQPLSPEQPALPENRRTEYKYASIMDYGFDVAIEGIHGVGSYDKAAIRFQYGQLIDVWNPNMISIPDPRKYGSHARRCGPGTGLIGIDSVISFANPEDLPSVLSVAARDVNGDGVVNDDDRRVCQRQDPGFDGIMDTADDVWVDNYDDPQVQAQCDSSVDALVRGMVENMEARAAQDGIIRDCAYLSSGDIRQAVAEFNNFIGKMNDLPPTANYLYSARSMVPMNTIIEQETRAFLNRAEDDDPNTTCLRDGTGCEDRDGVDNDFDGILDDKGVNWSEYLHRVPYAYCSDRYAGFSNPRCQRWDAGWDFLEAMQQHANRYDRDYVFRNFRRDRFAQDWLGWGNTRSYLFRLLSRRFRPMANTFQYYVYTRGSFLELPVFQDYAEAAYEGVNFLERVIQTPEPGRYCLNEALNHYEPWTGGACNQPHDVGMGYGEGAYLDSSWTNEYFYKPNRIGNFYDKWAAIYQLTTSAGFFYRDVSQIFDARAFSLGYLRVYTNAMVQRFASLITDDYRGYRPHVVTDVDPLSGEEDTFVRYTPFFDEQRPDGASMREWLENGNEGQAFPTIEPARSWSLRWLALAYALNNWSSLFDSSIEYHRLTKIAIKDTIEDVQYGPEVDVVEFTDPETLLTYRAPCYPPQFPAGRGELQQIKEHYGDYNHWEEGKFHEWSVGCGILQRASCVVDSSTSAECLDRWPQDTIEGDYLTNEEACASGGDSAACERFERNRRTLRSMVATIDIVRKISRRAEDY